MNSEILKRIASSIILIPLSVFIIVKGSILFTLFLIFCFLICSYEWYKMVNKISIFSIGFVYLILSFVSVYNIREDLNLGYYFFLFVLCVCVASDIGGYVVGKIFKGPKLTKISPNKTYSGMLGSFTLSLVLSYLFLELTTIFPYLKFNSINTLIFILLISLISQVGDIIISYFKRKSKIKNTGNIIPGHGGLLDRIDGMIFAFPFGYLVLYLEILK